MIMNRFTLMLACALLTGCRTGPTSQPFSRAAEVVPAAAPAAGVEIRAEASSGEARRLVDGNLDDRSAFHARQVPLAIEVAFSEPQDFLSMRIHPGYRGFVRMPSNEGSPRELTVSAWIDGQWIPVTDVVSIPRDTGVGAEFYVDIPLETCRTDRLRIDVLSSHDSGRRIGSGDRIVVPPEERSIYIREIEFLWESLVQERGQEHRQLAAQARTLLDGFRNRTAAEDPLGETLREIFACRAGQLEEALLSTPDVLQKQPDLLQDHYDWLSREMAPYLHTRLQTKSGELELTVRCEGGASRTPAAFPLNFRLLEHLAGQTLSRDNVEVHALDAKGNTAPLYGHLELLTPDRGVLSWVLTEAPAYRVRLLPPEHSAEPLRRLLGTGDHMMMDRFIDTTFPGATPWSAKMADVFDTARPALVAGFFTDYAHIYENQHPGEGYAFSERRHFIARDPFDVPIQTTDYHGRATAIADPVDLDGDGRIDLVLSRFNAEIPLFVRHIGDRPGTLEYDSARPLTTLEMDYRYAYGDLDGDGIANAVGVRVVDDMVEVTFWRGSGEEIDGAPRFEDPIRLPLEIPDSTAHNRRTAGKVPVVSLDDLNGNGALDISVLAPPYLYVAFAVPGEPLSFEAPRQVMDDSGEIFTTGFYFPHIGWHDFDGDGIPDLMTSPSMFIHHARDSILTLTKDRVRPQWLRKQQRVRDLSEGLANFDIADLAGDGRLHFLQIDNALNLCAYPFADGVFGEPVKTPLDAPRPERYGCPDHNEYSSLYAQLKVADLDGDGRPDLLLNTEHNWRFGYYSFYRNLGDGRFSPEIPLVPNPDRSHLRTVPSPTGKALLVDEQSNLDYLSLRTADFLSAEGGKIVFSYSPQEKEIGDVPRTFFSMGFWRPHRTLTRTGLYQLYLYSTTVEEIFARVPYFALLQQADGTLHCQLGNRHVATTDPVSLDPGTYYIFEVSWDKDGTSILLDGTEVAATENRPERLSERIHLGSFAWHGMQREREYRSRWEAHPVDFSFPANGRFDFFRFENSAGRTTLDLDFEENLGGLEQRSKLAYRCTPGVTVYEGKPALVAHFGDHRREERGEDKAILHVVPFVMEEGQPPRFEEAIPLVMTDGTPFYAFSRTRLCSRWQQGPEE